MSPRDGAVVSVDIDEGVTTRTRADLDQLGLTDRVEAITPDGILVVTLQIAPGLQRVMGFRKKDGRLVSESTVPGRFVPLQGAGMHTPPSIRLTGPSGKPVTFTFPGSEVPEGFAVSDDVLASDPVEAWSGVIYKNRTIWLDLLTYPLVQPGTCAIEAEDPADRGSDMSFYPALIDGASFAALHRRSATETTLEIGAIGKGPDAPNLTQRFADMIARYGARHRGTEPLFQWWPPDTRLRITGHPWPTGQALVDMPSTVDTKGAHQMQDGRSLQAWVWVIAVIGYLILPVVAFFSVLNVGVGNTGDQGFGGFAGAGVFVIPVLTWFVTLAIHHERRAYEQKAVDGVVLNWIGGILVAGLVVTIFGTYVLPRITEYLERHEQVSLAYAVTVHDLPVTNEATVVAHDGTPTARPPS